MKNRFVYSLLLFIACYLAAQGVVVLLSLLLDKLWGVALFDSFYGLMAVQAFSLLLIFALPSLFIAKEVDRSFGKLWQRGSFSGALLALVLVLTLLIQPLIGFLTDLNEQMKLPLFLSPLEEWMRMMEDSAQSLTDVITAGENWLQLVTSVVVVALITGFCEELFFRGIVQRALLSVFKNTHAAVWVCALLFAAFHLQFYGFLPRMVLALLFGYIVALGGRLWLSVAAHAFNNAMVIFYSFAMKQSKSFETFVDKVDSGWSYELLIGTLLLFVVFAVLLFRILRRGRVYA